ncbi:hypothetical protein [Sporolactobacillus terrae]|uniref:hypothetical protein n=1 Tax=Sporolactobacillus terrae TaxID=269673 RepID=UPI00159B8552|nr:hypothetical protein [Sporolactobacillus terrae]
MKFKYAIPYINIRSEWFDKDDNTYEKMGKYRSLFLYFQLYRFRIYNQESDHIFVTSIGLLKQSINKYCNDRYYTIPNITNLLKSLVAANVIRIDNIKRWDRIDKNTCLVIEAVNPLPVGKIENQYFIKINFNLFDLYHERKLSDAYFALYCLIAKYSNNPPKTAAKAQMTKLDSSQGSCYMKIETMSDVLGIDKNTINRMIWRLNSERLMCSPKKKFKTIEGYYKEVYQHYILKRGDPEGKATFEKEFGDEMDKIKFHLDARQKRKQKKGVSKSEAVQSKKIIDNVFYDEDDYKQIATLDIKRVRELIRFWDEELRKANNIPEIDEMTAESNRKAIEQKKKPLLKRLEVLEHDEEVKRKLGIDIHKQKQQKQKNENLIDIASIGVEDDYDKPNLDELRQQMKEVEKETTRKREQDFRDVEDIF